MIDRRSLLAGLAAGTGIAALSGGRALAQSWKAHYPELVA